MKRKRAGLGAFMGVLVLFCGAPALHADIINFTLTQAMQTGTPGDTLVFRGTLMNPTATAYGLADTFTTSVAFLTVDDTDFILNTPATLAAGATVGPVDLFSVMIGPSATPGTYGSNFFNVVSGSTVLGTQEFTVTVTPAGTPTPEPTSLLLFSTGLLAGIGGVRRNFKRQSQLSLRHITHDLEPARAGLGRTSDGIG